MGVCEEVKPSLRLQFVEEHLQALFYKIVDLDNFTPYHISLEKMGNVCCYGYGIFGFLGLGFLRLVGTCSEVVFLLEEALLVVGCSTGTYLNSYLPGAVPLVAASSGEEAISSTYWVCCSEGSVCLGVLWVFLEDFVEGFEGGEGVMSMG